MSELNELDDYSWLTGYEAERLLTDFAGDTRPLHNRITALRKVLSPERARLVSEQIDLRERAQMKFGEFANRMFFTSVQLQQATDLWVARYKAQRFDTTPSTNSMADYCCGIGGDLVAFAQRGSTVGWERDPGVALLAEANLRVFGKDSESTIKIGDVEQVDSPSGAWHVDPDRRQNERRSVQVEFHAPSRVTLDRWIDAYPSGAVKLAPAASPPLEWQEKSEQEWISRGRECKQLLLWFGSLSKHPGKRRATRIQKGAKGEFDVSTFAGNPELANSAVEQPARFVFDPDPALIAADLTGAWANRLILATLGPGAVYLTGDTLPETELLTPFEVLEVFPLKPKAIREHLKQHKVGRVEIKVRGVDVRPETFRQSLALKGNGQRTLILTRIGPREVAIVATRIE
ncbi:THUMP-like domain-containing protein [Adhaeretor mobilis]|uniref:THUMP-like domain-containing protein n=1 Tax=Adhaeretor mobilis TaxID=1930276 RepID=A0A517MXP2_9BACT|nr:hypothetical protein [Adhaeretor mobilis]QDS99652.1 hypothetical protein HG15A2_29790 [Adhaeretor mobilis]